MSLDSSGIEQGRDNVVHMGQRRDRARHGHAWHTRDDQWNAQPAFAGKVLVAAQGRCGGAGPAWAIRCKRTFAPGWVGVGIVVHAHPGTGDGNIQGVRRIGAVVGQKDKNRVVVLSTGFEVRHQAAHLEVHRLGHTGVHLHMARLLTLLVHTQLVPVGRARQGNHVSPRGNQIQGGGAVPPRFAQGRPALIVAATVFLDEFGWSLQWNMVGLETDVGKEWLFVLVVGRDVLNGLVHKKFRRVIVRWQLSFPALLEPIGFVVQHHVGSLLPVVRAAVGLNKGALKSTLTWQFVWRLAQVPLAGDVGVVPVVLEHRGQRDGVVVERTGIAGLSLMLSRHGFGHVAHAIAVIVNTGQQHGARRRANGGHMKVGELRAAFGQYVQVGRGDLAAVDPNIGIAPIVCHQHDDVRAGLVVRPVTDQASACQQHAYKTLANRSGCGTHVCCLCENGL